MRGRRPSAHRTIADRPLPCSLPCPHRVWWLLALVAAGVWFATLDARQLQHADEGRYAEIAREMAVNGNWVTPRLNDLKYFEKPPLQYWLGAATFLAFGVDEWTARLPGALAGFLAVLVVGFTAWRLAGAGRRRVRGAGAAGLRLARRARAFPHARCAAQFLADARAVRIPAGATSRARRPRATQLDAARVRRRRRRDAHQGPGRAGAARAPRSCCTRW